MPAAPPRPVPEGVEPEGDDQGYAAVDGGGHVLADFVMVNNDKDANARGSLVGNDDYKCFEFRFMTAF